jgi:DNA-binding transcriptional MerR regulator
MTSNKDHRYGIGAVAKLTGLSDHTIRVWERRYDAVVAERAANGRRVYSPSDVEKLGLLKTLTDHGLAIGQIAADSLEALRERVQALRDFVQAPMPDRVAVALLGDFLHGLATAHDRDIAPVEILVADSSRDSFVADLARHPVDVVAVEVPVLDADAISQLQELMTSADAARGIIVYSFGRARDVARANDARIVTLRAPIDIEELRAAVLRAYAPPPTARIASTNVAAAHDPDWQFSGPVAPRRFNKRQLSTLAHASTAIDCECPQHLAQLVGDLTAFEIYSAQCANRDDEDAALHRYLHQTTAQARALIEGALERVAEAEDIEY